jgi:cellulose synthase/poly-beta-1,6-N-acetylglucosamine synthase-like glycosyltransferase
MANLFWLEVASAVFVAMYFPIALVQTAGIVRGLLFRPIPTFLPPKPGRRIITVICTNGQNPEVVQQILARIQSYGFPIEQFVIKEERDGFAYSAREIVVPKTYQAPKGSRNKMRALHFGTLWLAEKGYGRETYIIFMDDDSVVTRDYVRYVYGMPYDAGQGMIHLRAVGHHLLSTLADFIRVTDCEVFCRQFNRGHVPRIAHGEGLVVRADVAAEIGWDYGTYGAEDLLMALYVYTRGYRFGFIPAFVEISPPTSRSDFFKQRRRWLFSFFRAGPVIREVSPFTYYFGIYRYILGWTGFIGIYLLVADNVLLLPIDPLVFSMSAFNLAAYFLAYQYGAASLHSWKYSLKMFALQFVVAFYEGGTVILSVFRPPSKTSFEVIRKV